MILHLPSAFSRVHSSLRILLVGAGGTGSQMLTGLARMHVALRALGHNGLEVTCADPDTVSPSNVGRQLFSPADVGRLKAACLIQRINTFHGLAWQADARAFGSDRFGVNDVDLLVGCVDTAKARRAIAAAAASRCRWWLDLGNDARTAQVVLGNFGMQPCLYECDPDGKPFAPGNRIVRGHGDIHLRDSVDIHPKPGSADWGGKLERTVRIPNVLDLFPKLASPKYRETSTPSCSLAESLRSQDLFINQAAATFALHLLWEWFRHGRLTHHGAFINLGTTSVRPLPLDPATWERLNPKLRPKPSKGNNIPCSHGAGCRAYCPTQHPSASPRLRV